MLRHHSRKNPKDILHYHAIADPNFGFLVPGLLLSISELALLDEM
jgi:hypothetical protein